MGAHLFPVRVAVSVGVRQKGVRAKLGHLCSVGQTIAVGVRVRGIRSQCGFGDIGQTIAVCIHAVVQVRAVEGRCVGIIRVCHGRRCELKTRRGGHLGQRHHIVELDVFRF